jgi:hypothetical protein
MDDYAVVIGINNYAKKDTDGFESLTSAVGDATRFIEWLRDASGGNIQETPAEKAAGKRRIIPILSPAVVNNQLPSPMDAKPVKDEIDNALMEFGLDNGNKIGRRLYFYFSGHGLGISSSDVAMMMANAIRAMESRNIGLQPYRVYLQERQLFDEVVFIADCCRNRDTRPIKLGEPVFVTGKHASPDVQDVTILAAEYGEPSYAISGGQGLLTQALLEGLKGDPGAVDQQGRITSNTLGNFLPKRVRDLAKQNLLTQDPEIDPVPKKAEIIFAHSDRTVSVKMSAADRITGEIVVCYGSGAEKTRKDADLARQAAPWVLELIDSEVPYLVRTTDQQNMTLLLDLKSVKENGNEFHIP